MRRGCGKFCCKAKKKNYNLLKYDTNEPIYETEIDSQT